MSRARAKLFVGVLSGLFLAFGFSSPSKAQSSWQATSTTSLNFRAGPGTNYEVVGRIPNGGSVTVYQCTDSYGWCDIQYGGARGWASGQYLAYGGSGEYYGRPIYSMGVHIGLPIIWNSYPIYRPRVPHFDHPVGGHGPRPGGPGMRPPRPTHPANRPHKPDHPVVRPPKPGGGGAHKPRPAKPSVRPARPNKPNTRPPNFRPKPGARPGKMPHRRH